MDDFLPRRAALKGTAFCIRTMAKHSISATVPRTQIEMGWNEDRRRLGLHLARGSRMIEPEGMLMWIGLAGPDAKEQVTFRGQTSRSSYDRRSPTRKV
jgi:hypothetical protein